MAHEIEEILICLLELRQEDTHSKAGALIVCIETNDSTSISASAHWEKLLAKQYWNELDAAA